MSEQDWRKVLGQRIAARRLVLDMSQGQLAEHFGIGYMSVSHWESGRLPPSLERIYVLAEIFGCEPHDLLPRRAELDGQGATRGDPTRQARASSSR